MGHLIMFPPPGKPSHGALVRKGTDEDGAALFFALFFLRDVPVPFGRRKRGPGWEEAAQGLLWEGTPGRARPEAA